MRISPEGLDAPGVSELFAAADAYPLNGVGDFADYESRLVAGRSPIEPRMVPAPVRMPLPPPRFKGSIYESPTATSRRWFEMRQEAAPAG